MSYAKHLKEKECLRGGPSASEQTGERPQLHLAPGPEAQDHKILCDRLIELEQIVVLVIGTNLELCREVYALAKARGDTRRAQIIQAQGETLKALEAQILTPF